MPLKAAWLVAWLLMPVLLACMPGTACAQQYSIRYHNQTQGLDNLVVTALAQDAGGFIWAGTENGLYRHDGAAFRRIELGEVSGTRRIYAVHIDKGGNVWVGTSQELYVLQAGRATAVRHDGAAMPVDVGQTLASDAAGRVLVVSKGRLFAVQRAAGGAWHARRFLEGVQGLDPQAGADVLSVHVDGDGAVWFGCGTALCRSAGEAVQVLRPPKELAAPSWTALFKDGRGGLWLRSAARLLQLPANSRTFIDRTPPHLHEGSPLLATPITEDAQGRIVTAGDSGLHRWNGRHWSTVGEGNGLSVGGGALALLADHAGGLWVGTAGLGLAQWLGYAHFAVWTAKEGLVDGDVWSFGRDRGGTLHVGTVAGVSRRAAGAQRFVPGISRPLLQATGSIAQDRHGYLWYGDSAGALVRTHPRTGHSRRIATLPVVLKVFVDSAGRVWVCTKAGIFLFESTGDGGFTSRRADETVNPDPAHGPRSLDACEARSGLLWFATDAGLLVWAQGRMQRVALSRNDGGAFVPTDFGTLSCTGDASVRAGGPESQGVWLVRWTGRAAEITDVTPPHVRERSVMGVLEDRRGWLWVSTDYGISVWNGNTRWRTFSQDSGLAWNDCNQGALYEDADGSIWVGSVRGATHIENVESIFDVPAPSAAIASVMRGRHSLDVDAPLSLSWGSTPLNVAFASPVYEDRRLIRFHYRLLGLDDDWLPAGGSEVAFAPLPPGDYMLQVRARNVDSQTESEVVSLPIHIESPWWRTPLFYALCAGVLLFAAWSLHAWRLALAARRQQALERTVIERTTELQESREQLRELSKHNARALEEERKHVSRELHDEMGQQLAALRMEVSVLGLRARADQLAGSQQLDMLLGRVDRLVASVRGLVQQLRPAALDGGLAAALEWLGEEFRRSSGIACQLDVDVSACDMDAEQSTMVFRIAQESLTNVRRHAQARQVVLKLQRGSAETIELSISDDGVGLDPDRLRAGYGLLGMQERAHLMGGELTIESKPPGGGTTIRLRVDRRAKPRPA